MGVGLASGRGVPLRWYIRVLRALRRAFVRGALVLSSSWGASGCHVGGVTAPAVQVPEMPAEQARCRIAVSHENPLVTEWPASEKANLEALIREGPVVVAYSGCSMKVLPTCRARGAYAFRRTTLATDTVDIRNADDLYAKLPLGAVSLEGELARSGRLAVQTTVAGQLGLAGFDASGFGAGCEHATHVVRALSVGAFKLRSGGAATAGGHAEIAGVGSARGSSSSEEMTMREAGVPARCELGTEAAPDPECASPIQVFLSPLPSSVVDRGPPGALEVRFLPVRADEKWDVVVGDRTLCTTPCQRWVDPAMPYTLKYDPGFFSRNEYWEVPDLRPHVSDQRVQVQVEPTDRAELVGGIVVTTFSGIAVVTGTALTAAGCGHSSGMCTAGLVTLPIGLVGLVPGIWMLMDSKGEVHVTPLGPAGAYAGPPLMTGLE
jgi:hypothetical protein